jgi:hypothetical protein
LLLDTAGNLRIAGNLIAAGFVYPSDRSRKASILEVDAGAVLEKVAALQISEWTYQGQNGERHMGPMAQDFHALFGLGKDDRHLSPTDTAGVTLAAIQGLHQKLQEKDRKIEALELRLTELERHQARFAELESVLAELQSVPHRNGN